MLDIKRIKEDPEKVKAGLRAKEVNCDQEVDRILALDKERRDIIFATEQMKAESPTEWVGQMNGLKAQVEEILLNELIYS